MVDVPVGDIDIDSLFGAGVAVDDISGDLFCIGWDAGRETRQTLYRVDRRTGATTVLATLPRSTTYRMDHLVATNGWVFWVESDYESLEDSGRQLLVYLAVRADGTERRELARYEAPGRSAMGEPTANSGFEAGGGTAMWLETRTGGRIVHLFDTRTATSMLVKNQPKVRELGSVHGDRVVLWTESGVQLYSIRTGQFAEISAMWSAIAGRDMIAGWVPGSSQLTACFLASTDPTGCDNPVSADTTESFRPYCIVGSYVVGFVFDSLVVELVNVAAPQDRMSVDAELGRFACGAGTLIHSWSVKSTTEDHEVVRQTYIRMITLA